MKKNEHGFSALEAVLIVVVICLVAAAAYFVYRAKSDSAKSSNATQSDSVKTGKDALADSDTPQTSTKKTVTFESASYSFELPKDWSYKEVSTVVTDEHMVYVADPTNTLQLEIQIIGKSLTSGSVSTGQTPEDTFVGINGKTYYLDGYKGNSTTADGYELLHVTACADKHCYTEINEEFDLNLAIRAVDLTPTIVSNPLVKDIEAIVKTIQL